MRRPIRADIANVIIATSVAGIVSLAGVPLFAQTGADLLQGTAAFGDWRADRPGTRRLIRPQDIPAPNPAQSASNNVRIVHRTDQKPIVPNGFEVNLFASGLDEPRLIRTAPNGDVFVAESEAGRIRVPPERHDSGASLGVRVRVELSVRDRLLSARSLSAMGLHRQHRFRRPLSLSQRRYHGARRSRDDRAEFAGRRSRDARRRVLAGSEIQCTYRSAPARTMPRTWANAPADGLQSWNAHHPLGAAWGDESDRADVLVFDPQGKNKRIFATGIRNCVGMAVAPATGTVWCSANERDGLGDNLPPDYITSVREGAFYGWPWFYIGANQDPRHKGERPDLKDKVTMPDVLIEAHSASLGMTFYDGKQFPAEYRGSIFAAEHGSWNRSKRTGYKIIRVIVKRRRSDRCLRRFRHRIRDQRF